MTENKEITEMIYGIKDLEKVVKAMEIIKDFCSDKKGLNKCLACPLGNQESGECLINKNSPKNWDVKISAKIIIKK